MAKYDNCVKEGGSGYVGVIEVHVCGRQAWRETVELTKCYTCVTLYCGAPLSPVVYQ